MPVDEKATQSSHLGVGREVSTRDRFLRAMYSRFLDMYVYVYMYKYVYIYVYTNVYMCIYTYSASSWHSRKTQVQDRKPVRHCTNHPGP